MAATSITGVSGPGDSLGLYKPENSSGCCGGKTFPSTTNSTTTVISNNVRSIQGCSGNFNLETRYRC